MPQAKIVVRPDPVREVVRSFAINEQINQLLIERLDPEVWQAKAPGARTRTIATIFAHIHNVRRKWIRLSAPHLKLPGALERACKQQHARAALTASAARLSEMIEEALGSPSERVAAFLRDGWARPWPAGPMMVAYMITHEAHHRGQVCMLAHQLGSPLPGATTSAMWNWERLSRR